LIRATDSNFYIFRSFFTNEQIKLVAYGIETLKPNSVTLGFDNDIAGAKYSFLAYTNLPEKLVSSDLDFNNKLAFKSMDVMPHTVKHSSSVDFLYDQGDLQGNIIASDYLKQKVDNLNQKYSYISENKPFDYSIKSLDDTKGLFRLEFRNVKDNWEVVADFVKDIKFGESLKIGRELSIDKDFNADLMKKLGLERTKGPGKIQSIELPDKNLSRGFSRNLSFD